jgi:cytochrome b6-f complex iron-sulfur subunit
LRSRIYNLSYSYGSVYQKFEGVLSVTGNELILDLNSAAYSKLNTVGNYVVVSGIVIARVSASSFAAVTQVCSHEGRRQVVFNAGEFYCAAHGARFDTAGKGLNSTGSRGLKTYATVLDGTNLKVTT